MLEKLKELLGEELSKQVAEKLGDVELGIVNDGSLVPAEKHDTMKAEFKALQQKYTDDTTKLAKDLENVMKNSGDAEELKAQIDKIKSESQTQVEQLSKQLETSRKDGAIIAKLIANNVDENYLPLIKSQIDFEKLSIDGENIVGLDDVVKSTIEKFPKLFGETKKVGKDQNPNLNTDAIKTKKQQLVDMYNDAQKKGDGVAMIRIQTQIQNLKE